MSRNDAFRRLLARDEYAAFPFERIPAAEQAGRRLAAPATNLGSGRGRFRIVFERLTPLLRDAASLCDVGVYPGTAPRLLRSVPGGERLRVTGLGLGFTPEFRAAMAEIDVCLHEVELDLRDPPPGACHVMDCSVAELGGPFELCLCTEVIEHQMHPVSLMLGLSRLTRPGGTVVMTTNSVSFVGDLAKLALGRHNVEALERSHVVADHDWRPHIRLFTAEELRVLFGLAGFQVLEARYFDNGNVYAGAKGVGMATLRALAGVLPHLRSHILVVARRDGDPDPSLVSHLQHMVAATGCSRALEGRPDGAVA
jgi:hypothetical protein